MSSIASDVKLKEPLLRTNVTSECDETEGTTHDKWSRCIQFIGFSVGVTIQISTIALYFFLQESYGEDFMMSTKAIFFFSFWWSLITSILSFHALRCIRVTIRSKSDSSQKFQSAEEFDSKDFSRHIESRFVAGAMIGVSLPWALTELALGMQFEFLVSLAMLAAGITLCQLISMFYTPSKPKQSSGSLIEDIYVQIVWRKYTGETDFSMTIAAIFTRHNN